MNIWQRKLLAFLHDPPHKALDIAGHEQWAEHFIEAAGLGDPRSALAEFDRSADHWAAAADRHPLFSSNVKSEFGGVEHPFKHPMGGSSLVLKEFPGPDLLGEWLQTTQPCWPGILDQFDGADRDRVSFFLHWRRWPVEAARDPQTNKDKPEQRWRSIYQPADTRMPDHPIWLHNSVTAALTGCNGQPAFLTLQLGPVQDFISQARSTRDLWSGSYMLSWLIAHAIKAVTDEEGPTAVIYPFLRAQPLFDLLHRDEIYRKIPLKDVTGQTVWDRLKQHENEMLVPNFPNKFLAIVPAEKGASLARKAEEAIRKELLKIAEACWKWIDKHHPLKQEWGVRYFGQIEAFPQITWQVSPWEPQPNDKIDKIIENLYGCKLSDLPHQPNLGLLWQDYYKKVDRHHAGRRNTRDFGPWMPQDKKREGASKDTLSGKEEIVGDMDWWTKKPLDNERFMALFRGDDKLGAVNIVKRVWHEAYLRDVWDLKPEKTIRFESVPDIAANKWLEGVKKVARGALADSPQSFELISKLCEAMRENAPKFHVRVSKKSLSDKTIDEWISDTAPDAFLADSWEKTIPGDGQKKARQERCSSVISLLEKLYEIDGVGTPPGYVAIIAMDGDSMGKWISGELTPRTRDQFSKEALEAYGEMVSDRRRPLSPSYHLQFSEALANFALYLVRPIVNHFNGQVIYAGGDDVLAMVPAANALACARALRNAFRGQGSPGQGSPDGVYEPLGSHGGFVRLLDPKGEQPTWPLIVPGPRADVSCGIAIGHCHSPLQNLVEAARRAESKAKKVYREVPKEVSPSQEEKSTTAKGAFCVHLMKRSGEVLQWGARWDSKAIDLMAKFSELIERGRLSARAPYALADLLRPYATDVWDGKEWKEWKIVRQSSSAPNSKVANAQTQPSSFDPFAVFRREFEHVMRQQGKWPDTSDGQKECQDFINLAMAYLGTNGERPELTCQGRRLDDFLGPFLTYAFISRRGGE